MHERFSADSVNWDEEIEAVHNSEKYSPATLLFDLP
jgi:hypothetical protein